MDRDAVSWVFRRMEGACSSALATFSSFFLASLWEWGGLSQGETFPGKTEECCI